MRLLDERGMPHGEITDPGDAFGMDILAFRDPQNIPLQLTAPSSESLLATQVANWHDGDG